MPRILLTNDDGIDAPGLVLLAKRLATIAEVDVVVPDKERSWVAKAITRYDPVTVLQMERDGVTIHACSGYPADCVQIGVHGLFPSPPDLVVSGINVGYNHGAAYLQSSGTAGAALEAGVLRVPAIAFSAGSMATPWAEWKAYATTPEAKPMWDRLAVVATDIAAVALQHLAAGEVLNVGLPDTCTEGTERRLTTVAQVRYQGLFAVDGEGTFRHSYGTLVLDGAKLAGTDVGAAYDEVISVTPIHGAAQGSASREVLEAITSPH